MTRPPLFVLGCPRSGTTLLAELVGRTPFGKPTETQFIVKYARKLAEYGDLADDARLDRLLGDILRERAVLQWKLGVGPAEIRARCRGRTYAEVVDALMTLRSERRGWPGWGDKTPHYTLAADVLDARFPGARYLFIVRDGRDVALSLLGRRWGPNNVYACARFWAAYNAPSALFDRLEAEGRLLRLRYEDLLADPRPLLERLYAFLGQPISGPDLDELAASIRAGNRRKWETRMKPSRVALFENVAGETLRRFGYETSHPAREPGPLTRARWEAHDRLLRGWELVRSNTIDAFRIRWLGAEPFGE